MTSSYYYIWLIQAYPEFAFIFGQLFSFIIFTSLCKCSHRTGSCLHKHCSVDVKNAGLFRLFIDRFSGLVFWWNEKGSAVVALTCRAIKTSMHTDMLYNLSCVQRAFERLKVMSVHFSTLRRNNKPLLALKMCVVACKINNFKDVKIVMKGDRGAVHQSDNKLWFRQL